MTDTLTVPAGLTEATDPYCLPQQDLGELLAGAPWRRFAVLGDSIAEGIGDPSPGYATVSWADRVANSLRTAQPDLAYLNTGRMGATSARVLDTQIEPVSDFAPDLVHITCGANDLWSPDADLAAMRANVTTVFDRVAATGAAITTLTFADNFRGPRLQAIRERMIVLNDTMRELAGRYDAVCVDLWQHPMRLRPNLLSADGIHFSMSGHAVLATEMVRALHTRITRQAADALRARP
ncbi:SGNH/GDSL hydrolase family protein [Rhodococcus sp. NPDC003348]